MYVSVFLHNVLRFYLEPAPTWAWRQHMEFDCTVAAQNGAPRWQRRLHELDEVERQGREAARQVLAGYEREMAETGQAVRLAVAADLHEHPGDLQPRGRTRARRMHAHAHARVHKHPLTHIPCSYPPHV